ncbi:MAG: hypothetical protein AB8B87_20525 [Granulosicoccus sp.]
MATRKSAPEDFDSPTTDKISLLKTRESDADADLIIAMLHGLFVNFINRYLQLSA